MFCPWRVHVNKNFFLSRWRTELAHEKRETWERKEEKFWVTFLIKGNPFNVAWKHQFLSCLRVFERNNLIPSIYDVACLKIQIFCLLFFCYIGASWSDGWFYIQKKGKKIFFGLSIFVHMLPLVKLYCMFVEVLESCKNHNKGWTWLWDQQRSKRCKFVMFLFNGWVIMKAFWCF